MPWVSAKHIDELEAANETLRDLLHQQGERFDSVMTMIALAQHGIEWNTKLIGELPARVTESCLADVLTRAQLKADTETQPLSIDAANRAKVRELREAQ